jgi:uncharacterized protein YjiS (DUF1127 family)
MGTISLSWSGALDAAGRSIGALRLAGARVGTLLATALVAVLDWQRRAHERHTLMSLDRRMLRDIGVSYADADREARKPFWLS